MASKDVENFHLSSLKELLSESGIECTKSIAETESEILPEEEELPPAEELKPEQPKVEEEEEKQPTPEEIEEETPYVFPTPSLRRVLPERVRKEEEHNRLLVLPEEFNTIIDPAAIPKIAYTPPQKYIDVLAELVGCERYKNSLPEQWFLDTLAMVLRRGQEEGLDRPAQAVLILWFCEWMKEMQYFDAADRKRMLKRFEDNMLAAAQFIADEDRLPAPSDIGVFYKEQDDETKNAYKLSVDDSKHMVTFEGAAYECSLLELTKIIHYIFDLFSTDYQYELVRSIFCHSPQYTLIDAPYQIQPPKRLYVVQKPGKGKKEKSPKKDAGGKGGKGKVKEELTLEFIALMELKAREEKELAEIEEREKEAWLRKCSILPLTMAADEEFFNKYWPPPPGELEPVQPVVEKPTDPMEAAKCKKGNPKF